MRARDFSLYLICVALATPLVMLTGVFSAGPEGVGTSAILSTFGVAAVIGMLAAGGVSIMGWSFKVPAVLTAFGAIYIFCAAMMTTMVAQMIRPWEVAAVFSGVFVALFAVVGYFAALEIAGGAHGPME